MKGIFESFCTGGFIALMFVICIVDSLNTMQIIASSAVVIGAMLIGIIGTKYCKEK